MEQGKKELKKLTETSQTEWKTARDSVYAYLCDAAREGRWNAQVGVSAEYLPPMINQFIKWDLEWKIIGAYANGEMHIYDFIVYWHEYEKRTGQMGFNPNDMD